MGDPKETKAKLLEAATELFAKKGFHSSTIRDIASEMNMSIANIYHHFGSKEGLLVAILLNSAEGIVSELHKIAEADMTPLERFRILLKTHLLLSCARTKEAKVYFLDREQLTDEGHEINLSIQRDVLEIYRKILGELAQEGYLRSRSATITAFNIFGVINWFLRWYRPDGALSKEEIIEEIMSFVMHGMLTQEAEAD